MRWLQPLLSGVFTVDNLDYVRRDAYLTGVAVGPVDVERLRRYTFVSEQGLTIYEPGLAALEMFLTARRFMYQQVYFHRTVRAIDLDLAEVFGESVRAIFGDGSPAERLAAYADLDEYALLHQAARWARGVDVAGGTAGAARPGNQLVPASIAEAWQSILLRRPNWRSEAEVRAEYEAGHEPRALIESLGRAEPGRGRDRPGDRRRAADRESSVPSRGWRSRCATARPGRRWRRHSAGCRATPSSGGATAGPAASRGRTSGARSSPARVTAGCKLDGNGCIIQSNA